MADNHSKEVRSKNMSPIRSTNSKPEEIVRKYLFSKGFRYRKNVRTLPGCPDIVLPKYLQYILSQSQIKSGYIKLAVGGTVKSISMNKLSTFSIPIPPLVEQQRIVFILDRFDVLVNNLSEGLPAEIAAVQEQYEYYRNKLLSFTRKNR